MLSRLRDTRDHDATVVLSGPCGRSALSRPARRLTIHPILFPPPVPQYRPLCRIHRQNSPASDTKHVPSQERSRSLPVPQPASHSRPIIVDHSIVDDLPAFGSSSRDTR